MRAFGPAINAGLSVSRVGGNAQSKAMKKVAGSLRLDLAQFRELEAFTKFGSELDKSTQAQINRGQRLIEILKQGQYEPFATENQIAIIFAAGQGLIDDVPVNRVKAFEKEFLLYLRSSNATRHGNTAHEKRADQRCCRRSSRRLRCI